MSILDALGGGKKQIEDLSREIAALKAGLIKSEKEVELSGDKNIQVLEKTHSFFDKLKLLVGTLESGAVFQRAIDLIDLVFSMKKGAILWRTDKGWVAEFSVGFPQNQVPLLPLDEESICTTAAKSGVTLTLAHIRQNEELKFLERRGAIPDAEIVCPVRMQGKVEKLIVICSYAGNVFAGEDDVALLQMISTILGLVMTNTQIMEKQKARLGQKIHDLERLRGLFSRMVAPEVIQHIEQNPDGIVLGGKRQKVVIMFADTRGFTQMSEKNSPEKVIELLNLHFTKVTDIVMKYKGTLDKFMGDAAMVLFGTPVPMENPCLAALKTAEEIQAFVQGNKDEWVKCGFPTFSIGVGLNFQEVIAGNVGSEKLSSYTVIGDGVNLASRICGLAKPGEIVVSQSFFESLKGWDGNAEKRTGITVKGKAEPITVFSLSRPTTTGTGKCPQCQAPLRDEVKFCGACRYRRP